MRESWGKNLGLDISLHLVLNTSFEKEKRSRKVL